MLPNKSNVLVRSSHYLTKYSIIILFKFCFFYHIIEKKEDDICLAGISLEFNAIILYLVFIVICSKTNQDDYQTA